MPFPALPALTFVKLSVLLLGVFNAVFILKQPHAPSPSRARQLRLQADPTVRLLHLDVPARIDGPVRLFTEETAHYPIAGPLADAEWASLIPSGNHGLVVVDDPDDPDARPPRAYAVTMFHTLHCLDRIRRGIVYGPEHALTSGHVASTGASPAAATQAKFHVQHCLNYVRQMVLCTANTRLNPINHVLESGKRAIDGIGLTYTCRDWNMVYDAFEANYALNRTMAWST